MIETLFGYFALGTLGFWILTFILSAIFIAAIENDNIAVPNVLLVLFGIAYWKSIISIDWKYIAGGVVVYGLVGLAWSVFRWFRHVKAKITDHKRRYGEVISSSDARDIEETVDVSRNKSRILSWIIYWPWSMIWNITGDFFNMLYESISGVYQKVVDNAMGGFKVENPPKNKIGLDPKRRSD